MSLQEIAKDILLRTINGSWNIYSTIDHSSVYCGLPDDSSVYYGSPDDSSVYYGSPDYSSVHYGSHDDSSVHCGSPNYLFVYCGSTDYSSVHYRSFNHSFVHWLFNNSLFIILYIFSILGSYTDDAVSSDSFYSILDAVVDHSTSKFSSLETLFQFILNSLVSHPPFSEGTACSGTVALNLIKDKEALTPYKDNRLLDRGNDTLICFPSFSERYVSISKVL